MKKLFSLLACGLLAAGFAPGFTAVALAASGYVHELTGIATVRIGAAAPRALKVGDIIDPGQTIATGDNSTAVIKFEDGQVMALSARSSFAVQDYFYNKRNIGASRAVFNLIQGGLRFVSGVIGATNPRTYRLTAGTATIGIRGTDAAAYYDAIAQIVTLAVSVGAVTMATPLGNQTVGVGNFSTASQNQAPTPPAPTAVATATVTTALNVLGTVQKLPMPVNTPVVVEASAKAAAAQAQATALQQAAAQNPANSALQEQAKLAQEQAATLLGEAVTAAQAAFAAAVGAGAVLPEPPALLSPQQIQEILPTILPPQPPASPS